MVVHANRGSKASEEVKAPSVARRESPSLFTCVTCLAHRPSGHETREQVPLTTVIGHHIYTSSSAFTLPTLSNKSRICRHFDNMQPEQPERRGYGNTSYSADNVLPPLTLVTSCGQALITTSASHSAVNST